MAPRLSTEAKGELREYTAKEIVLATDNFSWPLRSESLCIWGRVYKGYIDMEVVSVKFLTSSQKLQFESMVKSLRLLGDPHLLSVVGFCSKLKCFVYEHIDDYRLLHKVVKVKLHWQDRIRIAGDICLALCFIKKARNYKNKPIPELRAFNYSIVPDYVNASNILIDFHLHAKINVVLKGCDVLSDKPDFALDVNTFGYLVLNLLTGIPGNFISYCYVRCVGLRRALDTTAGEWPMDLAVKLMNVCRHCVECDPKDDFRKKYIMVIVVKEMNEIREFMSRGRAGTHDLFTSGRDQESNIPRQFYCPIFMEVMKDPHVAADGFSYEREGIEKWLKTGRNTSPMTNLKLENKILTPNGTLKLLIKDWYRESSGGAVGVGNKGNGGSSPRACMDRLSWVWWLATVRDWLQART